MACLKTSICTDVGIIPCHAYSLCLTCLPTPTPTPHRHLLLSSSSLSTYYPYYLSQHVAHLLSDNLLLVTYICKFLFYYTAVTACHVLFKTVVYCSLPQHFLIWMSLFFLSVRPSFSPSLNIMRVFLCMCSIPSMYFRKGHTLCVAHQATKQLLNSSI